MISLNDDYLSIFYCCSYYYNKFFIFLMIPYIYLFIVVRHITINFLFDSKISSYISVFIAFKQSCNYFEDDFSRGE